MSNEPASQLESEATLPRCLGCHYILVGLAENRCPECGRAFDPEDPKTMHMDGGLSRWTKFWLSPPGKWPHLVVGLGAVIALLGGMVPGGSFLAYMIAFSVFFYMGIAWSISLVIALICAYVYRHAPYREWRTYRQWAKLPTIVVCTILLVLGRVPLYVSFLISKPAMDRLAQQAQNPSFNLPREKQIGLYPTYDIERCGSGIRFLVHGSNGLLDSGGFAYSTNGAPPTTDGHCRHFFGSWYIYIEHY